MASTSTLPQSAYNPRRHVGVHAERVSAVSSTEYPGHYPDEDHSWDLQKFSENLQVKVQRLSQRSIEFDLVGVDASIANAFRRIMIAEVPTIAIEHVYVWNNTSVIHDEVLAHRIGLVPLNANPALFDFRTPTGANAVPNDRNTLVFRLQVACERAPKGSGKEYIHDEVTSGDLVWVPQGEQADVLGAAAPAPTNRDIVLAKLRPGQEIDMELHAVKGVGKEHAKWSPVATASYRLHPLIVLNPARPVPAHRAAAFAACFSPGVVVPRGPHGALAVDARAMRADTVSREVLRHEEFAGCVELRRIRDWFLFAVESEGPYAPERLLPEAVAVMRRKLAAIRAAAHALLADADADGDAPAAHGGDADVEMGES